MEERWLWMVCWKGVLPIED